MTSVTLRLVALVRNDISWKFSASFIKVRRIGELGTILLRSVRRLLVTASVVPSSPILVTLMKRRYRPKRRLLQEPHGVTSQKTLFFKWFLQVQSVLLHENQYFH
jgi:hypothetical protein